MINRLCEIRLVLERMIIDDEWYEFLGAPRRKFEAHYQKGMLVWNIIQSDGFWNTCEFFLYMVIPILKVLYIFDSKAPAMERAWRLMNDLENHV